MDPNTNLQDNIVPNPNPIPSSGVTRQIVTRKNVIFLTIVIFIIAGVYAFYITKADRQERNSESKSLRESDPTPTSGYDQSYFDEAKKQGRELTDEEKKAYMLSNSVGDNLITAHQRKKEVACTFTINDNVSNYHLKNGKIRVDFFEKSSGENTNIIYTPEELWAWMDDVPQQYLKFKNDNERTYLLISVIFQSDDSITNSSESFEKFCNYESVQDALFVPPTGIGFENM